MAAAATATPRDAHGNIESSTSNGDPNPVIAPGSGTLTNAANKLRDQLSVVLNSTLYINVAFDAFHTPHAPSFDHNCEMTSKIESDRLRTS